MFEIQKNDFMSFRMMPDRMKADPSGIYDFTFEGRYIIYHYRHQVMNHYIALDKTTGLGSSVMMTRERMDDHNYPMMIPAILYAIKYTGDRRMNMGEQIQRGNWIDMIFHCLLPQIGFSVREDQVRMANVMALLERKSPFARPELVPGRQWHTWRRLLSRPGWIGHISMRLTRLQFPRPALIFSERSWKKRSPVCPRSFRMRVF